MNDLNRLRVVVAGAGAIGSVLALQLVRGGADVLLADPGALGENASGVAAGMLAPVFEALLDPASTEHYPILRQALDAWPALMRSLPANAVLDRSGAMLRISDPTAAEVMCARMAAWGAPGRLLDAGEAPRLAPGVVGPGAFLLTRRDWRLDPRIVLAALHDAFIALGGRRIGAPAVCFERGLVHFDNALTWGADIVILATGFRADSWVEASNDAADMTPIKGQILRFAGVGPHRGPVVRGEGVYVVPDAGGVVVGATMEAGRRDLNVDPEATGRLRTAAARLFPHLAHAPAIASVGVRGATADALPIVGPSRQPGVLLARGARRNGWLLAPLIAQVILDHLLASPPSASARLFDPRRFR
jgi:glycine oxidase